MNKITYPKFRKFFPLALASERNGTRPPMARRALQRSLTSYIRDRYNVSWSEAKSRMLNIAERLTLDYFADPAEISKAA